MKKIIMTVVAAVMVAMSAQAQIPAEVKDVMDKCRKAMNPSAGIQYNMDIRTKMGPVTLLSMNVTAGIKGGKSKRVSTSKSLGIEIKSESGFDGTQEWKAEEDTVIITKTSRQKKDGQDLNLNWDNLYRKAKMKLKGDNYIIEFSDPIDKELTEAKKMTVIIAKKDYHFCELSSKVGSAKMVITISNIKIGLNDDYFKLDLSKYPNAVVIRK